MESLPKGIRPKFCFHGNSTILIGCSPDARGHEWPEGVLDVTGPTDGGRLSFGVRRARLPAEQRPPGAARAAVRWLHVRRREYRVDAAGREVLSAVVGVMWISVKFTFAITCDFYYFKRRAHEQVFTLTSFP